MARVEYEETEACLDTKVVCSEAGSVSERLRGGECWETEEIRLIAPKPVRWNGRNPGSRACSITSLCCGGIRAKWLDVSVPGAHTSHRPGKTFLAEGGVGLTSLKSAVVFLFQEQRGATSQP